MLSNIYCCKIEMNIAYCNQKHAEKPFVIMLQGTRESRFFLRNMLPINSSHAARDIPYLFKIGNNFHIFKQCVLNYMKYLLIIPLAVDWSTLNKKAINCWLSPDAKCRRVIANSFSAEIGYLILCFLVIFPLTSPNRWSNLSDDILVKL